MAKQKLEVGYGDVYEKFKHHIGLEHNRNILFSGKFGVGKSTFINHFFEKNKKNYYPVILRPVNYVVSSNENIFDLIKVDIIKQLFLDGQLHLPTDEKIGQLSTVYSYIKLNPFAFTRHLSATLAKLHPVLEIASSGFARINDLISDFGKFEAELIEKLKTDEHVLMSFAEEVSSQPGSYIEYNLITQILRDTISSMKKETVLVIDDLDRLDPEHIFRILNIFSSHNDHFSNEHKFGFNKVILIADIDNLKSLYEHRYGLKAEFEGYIDKFYSTEIFSYTNEDALKHFLANGLKVDLSTSELRTLCHLLELLVKENKLTIRNIIKYRHFKRGKPFAVHTLNFEGYQISKNQLTHQFKYLNTADLWISSDDVHVLHAISCLCTFFGSLKNFKEVLVELKKKNEAVPVEVRDDYVTTLAIMSRIADNWKSNDFGIYLDAEIRNDGVQPRLVRKSNHYPTGTLFHISYQIIYQWSMSKNYEGQNSFFSGATVHLDPSEKNKNVTYAQVAQAFINIIHYIERNNFKTKLGIVSD